MNNPEDASPLLTEAAWHAALRDAGRVPLQQSFAYGQAMRATGRQVRRFMVDGEHAAQMVVRRLPAGIGLALLGRGPSSLGRSATMDARRVLAEVRKQAGRCALLWSPLDPVPGLGRPVVTGYATVWIDLRPEPPLLRRALDGKWRNQLGRAEAHRLKVKQTQHGPAVQWLARRHERHRRQVGYRALPVAFLEYMAHAAPRCRDRMVLVAEHQGVPVAGIWLQIHHGSASYLIGYADDAGRQTDAMRLLLWQGMLALRNCGVRWLDLGGVATDRAPGLSRFKFGLGGDVTVEAGTYFRQLLL